MATCSNWLPAVDWDLSLAVFMVSCKIASKSKVLAFLEDPEDKYIDITDGNKYKVRSKPEKRLRSSTLPDVEFIIWPRECQSIRKSVCVWKRKRRQERV